MTMANVFKTNCKRKYTEQDLKDGIDTIRSGISAREASRTFGVPRTTLDESDVRKHRDGKLGRLTIFTEDEERVLAKLLIRFAQIRSPYNKNHLRTLILQLAAGKGTLTFTHELRHPS